MEVTYEVEQTRNGFDVICKIWNKELCFGIGHKVFSSKIKAKADSFAFDAIKALNI